MAVPCFRLGAHPRSFPRAPISESHDISAPSPAPSLRSVREVLPHTAHRRPSSAAFGWHLGRSIKCPLQFSDFLAGGPSHFWHSPALPIACGCVVHQAVTVLLPPPTPSRHATRFPALHRLWGGILPAAFVAHRAGEGLPHLHLRRKCR